VDRVSARGFALGYAGGGLHLIFAVALLFYADQNAWMGETAERVVIASAGLWWAGFGAFAFSRLQRTGGRAKLPETPDSPISAYVRIGFSRTLQTTRSVLAFKQLALFLLAFLFYNDGVSTAIRITPVYATETLLLDATVIAAAFVVIQLVAFVGALLFGWLAGVLGTKQAIMVSIAGWVAVAVAAYLLPAEQPLGFLGVGALAGLVLGGVQALSRSLYASMIPEEASAEFFGFYSVFSKFSSIFGPLIFAAVGIATGSSRLAILFLATFFVIGAVVLSFVDVDEGRQARNQPRTLSR
jgi:UMF1 family MFS transporter